MTEAQQGEPRKRTERKRKRRRRPGRRDEIVYYVVAIEDWDWSFYFSAGQQSRRAAERRYQEYRHLEVTGRLIRAARMNIQSADLTFLPDYREDERDMRPPAPMVGSIDSRRGRFTGLLTMPADALPPVLQMLIGGKFRFVVMSGERTRYGHATITGYRFEMQIDEHDLPADE
jgi:hypothetical protein